MKSSLLILTDYGPEIGLGHFTRCLSLSEYFVDQGWDVRFALFSVDKVIPQGANFYYSDWHSGSGQDEEIKNASLVLVDSFRFSQERVKELEALNHKLVFLDDYVRRDYHSGVVIDWTINSDKTAYLPRRERVLYLLGHNYCSLRKEFKKINTNLNRTSLMISFGGSDYRHLTGKILNFFNEKFSGVHKHVVIGPSAVWNKQDEEKYLHCTFHHALDAAGMQQVMSQSSVAICNGGQSLYEMASQGVVPIAISAAENQNEDIVGFVENDFSLLAGNWDDERLLSKLEEIYGQILSANEIRKRAEKGMSLIDCKGAERLFAAITKHYGVNNEN